MNITKNTALAFVSIDSITDENAEILAVGKQDVEALLAGSVRAEPAYGMEASHVTNTTRKYQCNADLRYAAAIKKLRTANDFTTDGAAIRMVMEAGLKALGFAELVEEVETEREDAE